MATTEAVLHAHPHAKRAGLVAWLTTVDHKRIGLLYGGSAFVFFLLGGLEALLLRLQLAWPDGQVLGAEAFNQLFTMHGTTMVFLALMPLSAAFFNYMVPLLIGARDVAFPRLNAFSFWIFFFGGVFMNSSFLFGAAPHAGWFGYATLTEKPFSVGPHTDFWLVGLLFLGVSSIISALNFLVTILNLRAPGMTFLRMPMFVWTTAVTAVLLLLAFPPITVALILLGFDRFLGTSFYLPGGGGSPVLWQHLFWIFGHPEVYILILPAFGIVSEVIPTFARKPLFGYVAMVYATTLIGFFGFGVWAHHMFAVGMGPIADSAFSLASMIIAVPTGIKIFNWLATLWGGSLRFRTALYFACGFIAMFTIGGLSGIMHASPPVDLQQTDTYFVVAHFHYVLFGGTLLGLFAGIYYWWPKATGRLLDERLGRIHFWVMLVGMNLTFFPMHFLGLMGMPRRIYTYAPGLGWDFWNLVATVGAFAIGVSILVFMWNAWHSVTRGPAAPADPWDARTLEWAIPSPPPEYNFATVPTVLRRDALWLSKHPDQRGPGLADREALVTARGPIHMPPPSAWPILTGLAMLVMVAGTLLHLSLIVVGGVLTVLGVFAIALEHLPARAVPAGHEDVNIGSTGLDHRKMGTWAFIGSECLFFGTLISTYLVYKGRSLGGPTPHEILNIPLTSFSTFDLLMSSLTMVLAVAAIQRGDLAGSRRWLAATCVLGLIFLGGQVYEFNQFLHEGLGLTTNLFGSTFYVLVGFHGAHVSVGVLWLATLWYLVGRGRIGASQAVLVDIAGLYWHFVDVVWIGIFTLIYLIQ
ncbi:MAG: cytochrome c oxidase subunit I [Candidatus Rokubacteria bacterium]|nr:cytochrome c oxidase subunit I [Candidatus Rokubacteria bacterium]